ncbi:hypothetical protein RND81_04G243800 [Saponaria officinalis]|uniref:MI domain-containing protein n=1 Tax=Saponaria officinalis TaxID=3572 RepID=A0AAW1LQQ1_SAPOF
MPAMDEEMVVVKERDRKVRDEGKGRKYRRGSDSEDSDGGRDGNRGEKREGGRERSKRRTERREEEGVKELVADDRDRRRKDNRRRDERENESESSDGERDRKKVDKRERDRNGGRKRGEREDEERLDDKVTDGKEIERKYSRGGNGRHRDSESFDGEDRRERDSYGGRKRKEREDEERVDDKVTDGKEIERKDSSRSRNGHHRDSESSDGEDRRRHRRGRERRSRRDDRDDSSDSDGRRKREREDEERLDDKVTDGKEIERKDSRSRNGRHRDSDSSDGEDRRRHKRGRERRSRRDDRDDSSDSDGRGKRDRNVERKDRDRKEKHDPREIRSRKDENVKMGDESKKNDRDEKEAVKPLQKKVVDKDENPGGPLATLGKTGGVYIPPFKLARMLKEIDDKSSVEYQRLTWDALRKSINGLVNKVNATNIKNIIPELFSENLIRGRGLFCRSCMKSQMASPGFTDVFAALVAVVNTKFPEIGDLLLRRIVLQLKRAYKRNDKPQLIAAVKFIAHLVNQQVAHELVALELLTILLEQPTDDSIEVAVDFVKECGCILQDLCPKGLHGIFERFRGILHEGEIDKRVQFLIEGLFAVRKAKFQGHPAVRPELDLVEPEDQLTHEISLDDEIDPETSIDIFRQDPNFLENERKYEDLKKSILGEESEDDEDGGVGSDEDEDEDDDDDDDDDEDEEQMQIKDATENDLINLRRTIYLTIMSSVDFEEAGHKLLKIKLEPGQEMELCIMLLECCSQERTYLRYYGLLGQRFCMINKVHQENFEKCFVQQYSMIHRLETNKLRNVAKFFAHLLGTNALPWHVLAYIRLTEEDTTSSSRIFIKILFQELSEHLGIRLLNERLNDPSMNDSFESIFPKDNPRNTRFAINFFTSIGLGGLTENLREYLKNMPRMIMQQQKPESEDESGSSGSSSSASDSSSSESDSESSSSSDDSDNDESRRRKRRKRR